MIVSGSPMWSPLASVIAVGLLYSMFMALLVIPVLFARVVKPADKLTTVTSGDDDDNDNDNPRPAAVSFSHALPASAH